MDRIIFTDGKISSTSTAANISRGGLFVKTLDPHPIESEGIVLFPLPDEAQVLTVEAKVIHVVMDRVKCEVECGMGMQFLAITDVQRKALDSYIAKEMKGYSELKRILASPDVSLIELKDQLRNFPELGGIDLLGLRYRVNRICTIFEPTEIPETRMVA